MNEKTTIWFRTTLKEMPENCKECPCHWCGLPLKRNPKWGYSDQVKKRYLTKRHEDCPLRQEDEQHGLS